MDPDFYRQKCEVDFCSHTHNFPTSTPGLTWHCSVHLDALLTSPDWDIVGDPDTGEDRYLLDGLDYRFRVIGPDGFSMQTTGSFDVAKSSKRHLVFHLHDFEEFVILPRDRFRFIDIEAI